MPEEKTDPAEGCAVKANRYLIPSEHESQRQVFTWATLQSGAWPELGLLFAVPNGGARNVVVGKKLKAEGVKAGVPDIVLPVPRGGFHGLFVEMKRPGNPPSKEQKEWLAALKGQGYCTAVCLGFDHAQAVIMRYLREEMPGEGA